MTASELRALVADGKFFSCCFVKRTDGTRRNMLARVGVNRTSGGELPYDPEWHDLLPVWDVHKRAYRMISCDNLLWVRHRGEKVSL